MSDSHLKRRVLAAGGLGLAAVVSPSPTSAFLFLWGGTAYAAWALQIGRGWGRILPAAVLVAIVIAAVYAPVKTIERAKASRMTVPRLAMTVAELRDPVGHGLKWPRPPYGVYQIHPSLPPDVETRVVRFPSQTLTFGEFIRAIEAQTPLRHHFASCGNGGSSILAGRNWAMGLYFSVPNRIADD